MEDKDRRILACNRLAALLKSREALINDLKYEGIVGSTEAYTNLEQAFIDSITAEMVYFKPDVASVDSSTEKGTVKLQLKLEALCHFYTDKLFATAKGEEKPNNFGIISSRAPEYAMVLKNLSDILNELRKSNAIYPDLKVCKEKPNVELESLRDRNKWLIDQQNDLLTTITIMREEKEQKLKIQYSIYMAFILSILGYVAYLLIKG